MSIFSWTLLDESQAPSGGSSVIDPSSAPTAYPRDLKIDPATGDLAQVNGDLVHVSGAEAIAQDLARRFQFFKGEWFADLDEGIPWFDQVLVKNPDVQAIASIFRDEALATPGVTDVLELTPVYDSTARKLSLTIRVSSDFGLIQVAVNP